MHVSPRAQEGFNLSVHNEAKCVIEAESVGVRRHGNDLGAAHRSDRGSVLDELTADSLSHPLRIYEKILKVKDAFSEDDGRETHDGVGVRGDSCPPFTDALPFENQRSWVGEESFAITLIGQ
ncbi:MAG: hypothetical protein ABI662_08195 [Dermatophilaceae bacterium]